MIRRLLAIVGVAALGVAVGCPPARAQGVTRICVESIGSQGANNCVEVSGTNPFPVTNAPSGAAAAGLTGVVSTSAENSHVLKAAAGNLYRVYATNQTGTAGFLLVFNATSAPVDGAVTPQDCAPLPGNSTATIVYAPGPPSVYSTGITAVVSSGANCFTKTTGVITAFIHGDVQ